MIERAIMEYESRKKEIKRLLTEAESKGQDSVELSLPNFSAVFNRRGFVIDFGYRWIASYKLVDGRVWEVKDLEDTVIIELALRALMEGKA